MASYLARDAASAIGWTSRKGEGMRKEENVIFEGGCLCGAVRYRVSARPVATVHCHCTDCRRLGGTGHATHTVVPQDAFALTGQHSEYKRVADSGNTINRRFCTTCGSAVFHTRDGMEGKIVLRTSSLDDPEIARPERSIYAASALSWDPVDPELPAVEGMTLPKE